MSLTVEHTLLPIIFAITAVLYAAVGQAGGTGYIAAMGLLGFAPEIMKPTALSLNISVAAIGCARFARAGLLTWRSCYPFAVLGAPYSLVADYGGLGSNPVGSPTAAARGRVVARQSPASRSENRR